MVSKNQQSFSVTDAEAALNQHFEDGKVSPITSQLYLKSSGRSTQESLDKEAVLRRIRHHKSMNRIRSALQTLAEQKLMELGDSFSSP